MAYRLRRSTAARRSGFFLNQVYGIIPHEPEADTSGPPDPIAIAVAAAGLAGPSRLSRAERRLFASELQHRGGADKIVQIR